MKITKSRQYVDGAYYAQLSELVVDEGVAAWDKVTVSLKAPHENGAIGGAAQQYIMRIGTSAVTSPTDGQAVSATLPAPGTPDTDESLLIEDLSPGTTYFIGLWSEDEEGNLSPGAFGSVTRGP